MPDHEMTRGDATVIEHSINDGNGEPLDLGSLALTFTAKYSALDAEPVIQRTSASGGITILTPQTGANKGRANTILTPANTSGLPSYNTTLLYELEVVASGEPYTVEEGTLLIKPDLG